MTLRSPQVSLALRIIALGCVVLWLAGISTCSLEKLFCVCNSHGQTTIAHTDEGPSLGDHAAEGESKTISSHDAHGHSHNSHKHESKEDSCCSTLKALVPTAKSYPFSNSAFPPILCLLVLPETQVKSPALSENPSNRQAKGRDWVFTPEVCLGPAFRSLAPPVLV